MNYQQTLEYIHGRPRSTGAVPALTRIKDLLRRLGEPQKAMKFVHVAGTNGKGSVTALICSTLGAAGFGVGMFTSPFLEEFRERIQLNGQLISESDLCAVTEAVKAAEDKRLAAGCDPCNEFEVITAAALLYYREKGCQLAVLETGLGGRFDPTNAIDPPLAAVITHIAMDHTAILGDTIEKIAYQKAGIIKTGSNVVIAPNCQEALAVLIAECEEKSIKPAVAKEGMVKIVTATDKGTEFEITGGTRLFIPLLGHHQLENALTAYMTLIALREKGVEISDEAIAKGFSDVQWPARLEVMSRSPLILLDSAHNPDGAAALAATIDQLFSQRRITAVMGMMADKDWKACVDIIAPKCVKIITSTSDTPRSLEPGTLADYAEKYCPVEAAPSLEAAIQRGLDGLSDGALLVCGSVIMAGQARTILRAIIK